MRLTLQWTAGCAKTGHSPTALRTGQLDPCRPSRSTLRTGGNCGKAVFRSMSLEEHDWRGSGTQGHAATLFPLSEAASWITDVTLDLAGGRVMGLMPGIDLNPAISLTIPDRSPAAPVRELDRGRRSEAERGDERAGLHLATTATDGSLLTFHKPIRPLHG